MKNDLLPLCDVHAHLDDEMYGKRRDEIVDNANTAGLKLIVNPGSNLESSRIAVDLAHSHDIILANCGVHPHDAGTWKESAGEIAALLDDPLVVAVGEIGLDYYWDGPLHEVQQQVFLEQLELARKKGLPAVVHCRDAFEDLEGCLNEIFPDKGVLIHCFSGGVKEARIYLDMGAFISLGGPVTFKNAPVPREVAAYVPLNRLLPETDAPYLTPAPFRGRKPNEPAMVEHVVRKLAEVKEKPPEEVAPVFIANACVFFGLEFPLALREEES